MKAIWKYQLFNGSLMQGLRCQIDLPLRATVVRIAMQEEVPCVWVLADTELPTELRRFGVFATGEPLEEVQGYYLGAYEELGGKLIWHLFEIL